MIQKLKIYETRNVLRILGGEEQDSTQETAINSAKSADKIHNKIVQVIMS